MSINEIAKEIHQNAIEHGWWEEPRAFGEIIALCHSELSEALEEYRKGKPSKYIYGSCKEHGFIFDFEDRKFCPVCCKPLKPEGIPIELADCIIRILDYCAHVGIDIEQAIQIKHEYNKTRPYRHGGKVI